MDYYVEITVLPDPEFEEQVLLNALFSKFHRGMGQTVPGEVGISFPEVAKRLGSVLRLHGNESSLNQLMAENWLKGMRDYCQVGEVHPVPEVVQYRTVRRVQAKSAWNKRKRSIAKGWLTEAEAPAKIPDSQQKNLKHVPFLQIKSLSNGNPMRIYIEHGALKDDPVAGTFNSYGLSATATIPWF
ncbi:MAG: type I-F CRISPR-associated endoribonuclease Cas6/Csy4 [Oceanospirillaceae bacterium]|nr:type I-F CRISPR-associated endoribonuclease Cas6/Csy4 [Oceanospirillaceae bacterium]|tara:strand:- start:279 stop:833 length:555 start_codon:yes stop_codon:yes gene_type:complete